MIWKNAIILLIIGFIASRYEEMDYFWLAFGVYMVMLVVYNTLSLYVLPDYKRKRNGFNLLKKYIVNEKNEDLRNFILKKYKIDKKYDFFPEEDVFTLTLIPKSKNNESIGIPDLIKFHVYKKSNEIEIFEYWINRLRYSKESGIIKKWFLEKNYKYYNLTSEQRLDFKNEFLILNHLDEIIERLNITVKRKILKSFYVSILFGFYIGSILLIKNILNLEWINLLEPKAVFLIFVGLSGILFSIPFLTIYKKDLKIKEINHIEKLELPKPISYLDNNILKENYQFYKNNYIEFDEVKELNHYVYKLNKDNKFLPTYVLINPFTKEISYFWGLELFSIEALKNTRTILNWIKKENIDPINIEIVKDKIEKSDIKLNFEKAIFN